MTGLPALTLLASLVAQLPPPPPPPPPPALAAPSAPARDLPLLPPSGSGLIDGVVVSAETTPTPIRNAVVTLRGDGLRSGWTAISDDAGRFSFASLPPGRFTLAASKPGWPGMTYGALKPGRPGASIVLKDGERATGLALKVPRGAVIAGRLTDAYGAPIRGASIRVSPVNRRDGERVMASNGGFDSTDDEGAYRVFGLAAGDYVVGVDPRGFGNSTAGVQYSASDIDAAVAAGAAQLTAGAPPAPPPTGQEMSQVAIYYPGVASLEDAQLVHVDAGETRADIDLVTSYVAAVSVSGLLVDDAGQPVTNVVMTLNQIGAARIGGSNFGRPSPVDGSFTFNSVTPGRYVITARATPAGAAAEPGSTGPFWARYDFAVSGAPVTGIRMVLQRGVEVSGAVVYESAASARPASARIGLDPVLEKGDLAMLPSAAAPGADGAFVIEGVTNGRYKIGGTFTSVTPASSWMLKSAMLDGKDVLEQPFDVNGSPISGLVVTFTDRLTEVSGVAQDPSGRPAPDYYIIVFAADAKQWTPNSRWIKAVRPGLDGRYTIRGLPPGEYRIGAVIDVQQNEWFEPSFLQQLMPASAALTLGEGEKKAFPIKLGGG